MDDTFELARKLKDAHAQNLNAAKGGCLPSLYGASCQVKDQPPWEAIPDPEDEASLYIVALPKSAYTERECMKCDHRVWVPTDDLEFADIIVCSCCYPKLP